MAFQQKFAWVTLMVAGPRLCQASGDKELHPRSTGASGEEVAASSSGGDSTTVATTTLAARVEAAGVAGEALVERSAPEAEALRQELGHELQASYWGSLQGTFAPVDGGVGRVCRGATPDDNLQQYYEARTEVASLAMCKSLCIDSAKCTGIEYSDKYRVCELWTRAAGPQSTLEAEGYTCLTFTSLAFEEVDGGLDRGCRGPGTVEVHRNLASLAACTSLCAATPACHGIEYATAALGKRRAGNCKLFEGDEGISWTIYAKGYTCFRLERQPRRLLMV